MDDHRIENAVEYSVRMFLEAEPVWIGMKPAREAVPGMERKLVLKSGPFLPWEKLCGVQRQGIINGVLFEGWADDRKSAEKSVTTGEVEYAPGNDYGVVCSGAGITTPSMVVNVVHEKKSNCFGFCVPFEGPNHGGLGGWGMLNQEIADCLRLMHKEIAPVLTAILEKEGGIPLSPIISAGFAMGDEMHNCQSGAGTLVLNQLFTMLIRSGMTDGIKHLVTDFLTASHRFFHPLDMATAIALIQPLKGVEKSPLVTAMAGNGIEFGIKIGAFDDRWFTAPSPPVTGIPIQENSLPWIGDSSMTETVGWGGFAAAASPAAARGLGQNFWEASRISAAMTQICAARNPKFPLAGMNNEGTPCCIDIRKVVETGISPVLHGGRIAPTGKRLGAGTTRVPMACFHQALEELKG